MTMQVRFSNAPRLQVRVVALPGNVIDVFGRVGHVVAQLGDYTASQITNVPAGSVTAATVQAAIDQLATGAGVVGAALTKTDDTNVTATLGGTPLTALLRATSIALGWTGTLNVSRGGIGTGTWAGTNSLVASGASGTGTIQIVANGATTGTVLLSNGAGALPGFGVLAPIGGGTGTGTWATNTIILGGTTATGTFQQAASGTSGTVLTSQGAGVLPTWAVPSGGTGTISGTNSRLQNVGFTLSVTSSSLTITLTGADGNAPSVGNEVVIDFRSQTGTFATSSSLTLTSSQSLTISSGSTLGVTSAAAFRLWIVGFNDASTFRLGAINCSNTATIFPLKDGISSSTAEGGAGAADSAGVIYTGSAVTTKAMRILGFAEWSSAGLAASGTWTTTNLLGMQVFGPGINKPGDVVATTYKTSSTGTSTGSTAYVSTNLSQAITPSSAANAIRASAAGNLDSGASSIQVDATLFRSSTQIGNVASLFDGTTRLFGSGAMVAFDFPNTASSVTYEVRTKVSAGTGGWNTNNQATTMILDEVMT